MTQALGGEQERLQDRRRQLQQLQAEMMAAIEREDFATAQQIMFVMDNDEDLGDPGNKFGLHAHIQVNAPFGNGTITNWHVLRNWLGDQQAQLKQIGEWLVGAGLAAKLDEYNAALPALTPDAPTGIANWPEIELQVQNLAQYGRFNEADRVLEQALVGNDGWFDNDERILALETAVQRLRQAPVRMEQATNHKALRLLEAGKECHEALKPYIEATKGQQKTIQQKRRAWEDTFAELEQAFKELEVVNRNVIARWRNRERMDQVRENAHRALLNCRQIAAQHPSLAGLQDHPLLSG
jgi:tetratricopeptide (TPR) repeat protein